MRDPELMQRADRAAIALEEAWERWRAMHGLGAEPLPPVSSYVGYSLEEPWGQPRVVFGLRADEAELLASLLEGHDCVGPIYAEVSTRPDRRRQVTVPAAPLARPYSNPLSVPAQAPPSVLDQMEAGSADLENRVADIVRSAGQAVDAEDAPADMDQAEWPRDEPEPDDAGGDASEPGDEPVGADQSPPLEPLPDLPEIRAGDGKKAGDDAPRPARAPRPRAGATSQGPGYRGPRYQGFPKRYEAGHAESPAPEPDADPTDEENTEPTPRRSHVAKLNRGTRRRANSG